MSHLSSPQQRLVYDSDRHFVLRVFLVLLALGLMLFAPRVAGAEAMFAKGSEVFELRNSNGRVPEFRILDDSTSKQALAAAIAATLNAQSGDKGPLIPVRGYIDLRVERLTFVPAVGKSGDLDVSLRISGHEMPLDARISRKEFLAGKKFELRFPTAQREVSAFSVTSRGKLNFRFDPKSRNLDIDEAFGHISFTTPLSDEDETENIRFAGRGLRM